MKHIHITDTGSVEVDYQAILRTITLEQAQLLCDLYGIFTEFNDGAASHMWVEA